LLHSSLAARRYLPAARLRRPHYSHCAATTMSKSGCTAPSRRAGRKARFFIG
jgi:hypothetical protein